MIHAVARPPGLTGLALAHGGDTTFWWTAGIFAGGAVIAGALLRSGPLDQQGTPSQTHDGMPTAQATAGPPVRHDPRWPESAHARLSAEDRFCGAPVARITVIR